MTARALVLALLAGCSAPATLADLRDAEQRERDGDVEGALAAYRAAQTSCAEVRPARRRQAACAQAALGEAELLAHADRADQAEARYLAIAATTDDPATAANALYHAGELARRRDDGVAAWRAWWRCITDFPDEPFAGDAVTELLRDGRGRDAAALSATFAELLTPLAETEVADNLLWAMAELAEHELADPRAARSLYDRIPVDRPTSGLRDDARFRAARLSLTLGDARGAESRLAALLATREVSFRVGSYFSIWLDDAQLLIGKVRRDQLHDDAGAERAFADLAELYPASVLRDDALWELAITQARRGAHAPACRTLAVLRQRFPESRYVARRLPAADGTDLPDPCGAP